MDATSASRPPKAQGGWIRYGFLLVALVGLLALGLAGPVSRVVAGFTPTPTPANTPTPTRTPTPTLVPSPPPPVATVVPTSTLAPLLPVSGGVDGRPLLLLSVGGAALLAAWYLNRPRR